MLRVSESRLFDVVLQRRTNRLSRQNPLIDLHVTHSCSVSCAQFVYFDLLAPKLEVFKNPS